MLCQECWSPPKKERKTYLSRVQIPSTFFSCVLSCCFFFFVIFDLWNAACRFFFSPGRLSRWERAWGAWEPLLSCHQWFKSTTQMKFISIPPSPMNWHKILFSPFSQIFFLFANICLMNRGYVICCCGLTALFGANKETNRQMMDHSRPPPSPALFFFILSFVADFDDVDLVVVLAVLVVVAESKNQRQSQSMGRCQNKEARAGVTRWMILPMPATPARAFSPEHKTTNERTNQLEEEWLEAKGGGGSLLLLLFFFTIFPFSFLFFLLIMPDTFYIKVPGEWCCVRECTQNWFSSRRVRERRGRGGGGGEMGEMIPVA